MKNLSLRNTLLLYITVGLAFLSGFITNKLVERQTNPYPLFQEAIGYFEKSALHPLPDPKELEYGMIKGMLESYHDPYTIFLEPPQHELQTNQLEGAFGGVGIQIERQEKGVLVFPFPDGPAANAGVLNGDILIDIDGMIILPDTTNEMIEAALRGRVGQIAKIIVLREDAGELTFEIRREEVAIPSVFYRAYDEEPRVGIIQVKVIADTTAKEILAAVQNLQKDGINFFILDLRNNGGGLLFAGVEIARLFLREGVVIEQQYEGRDVEPYAVNEPGVLADIPLVVLVNRHTASSAEIIAGAIQAKGRAVLIGEPTFGKDTIQQVFELKDGSSLHITSAHWWIPGLAFPSDGVGLKPSFGEGLSEEEWITEAIDSLLENP